MACWPPPMSSCHVTHGTVGPPGTRLPAATLGSSAFPVLTLFSAQLFSRLIEPAHAPNELAPVRSRVRVCPAVPLPTACQWNPPAPVVESATPLAANTMSLPARPTPLGSSSYH